MKTAKHNHKQTNESSRRAPCASSRFRSLPGVRAGGIFERTLAMDTNIIELTLDTLNKTIESLIADKKDLCKRCHRLADATMDEIRDGSDRSAVREKYARRIKKEVPKP